MNCPHHIQWVMPVTQGLHQCMLCYEVVSKKDVIPKFDDLGPDFQKRWDEHEQAGAKAPGAAAQK